MKNNIDTKIFNHACAMLNRLVKTSLRLTVAGAIITSSLAEITLEKKSSIIFLPDGGVPADIFDASAAEIVAYDSESKRLFIVNGFSGAIDVVDIADVENPQAVVSIDLAAFGGAATSVAVNPKKKSDEIAVAVPAATITDPGSVIFFDTDGNYLNQVTVGALPDMLTYDSKGKHVFVANEGEPADGIDPEGSVAIIEIKKGAAKVEQDDVHIVGFTDFNDQVSELTNAGVRLFPDVLSGAITVAQDLEPEYVTVSDNGKKLFVALQETNSIAEIDIKKKEIVSVFALGSKDHSVPGNGLDPSDKDDAVSIANWPVSGMYMPDAIAAFKAKGGNYIATANEGDARTEDARVKDIILDPTVFPNASILQADENLGRLGVSTIDGDIDGDGDYDQLLSYGARSFTIWSDEGDVVFDSGDDFEQITASVFSDNFNASNSSNSAESRSDNKGPEPESVVIAKVNHELFAFVGLERIGGVMIYNVSDPANAYFVNYINCRDFLADPEDNEAGDLGPEGLFFIPKKDSPSKKNLLIVANEVSGTTTIFEIVKDDN